MPKAELHSPPPSPPENTALGSGSSGPAAGARVRAEGLWGGTDKHGRHSPCYGVERGSQPHRARTLHHAHPAPPYQGLSVSPGGSSATPGAPGTAGHQLPPPIPQGPSLDTGCSICSSRGRSRQHPASQALPGLRVPRGGSWLRSLPAPESIQGEDKKHQEGQGSQAAGDGSVLRGKRRLGSSSWDEPCSPKPSTVPTWAHTRQD